MHAESESFGEPLSNQGSSTEYAQDLARLRALQQAVLLYLIEAGPATWDTLYIRFTHYRTDEIAHTLRYLARWAYITIEADSTTRITVSGAIQLQRWSA